jgi:hypothetical protein
MPESSLQILAVPLWVVRTAVETVVPDAVAALISDVVQNQRHIAVALGGSWPLGSAAVFCGVVSRRRVARAIRLESR